MKIIAKINSAQDSKLILIILLLGFITFANMLGNAFVWDDEETIVNNSLIVELKNIPALFSQSVFNTGGPSLSGWVYRPLLMTFFALIHSLFGLWPPGFHLVQLIFHLTNASLLFVLLKKLLGEVGKKFAKPIAFLMTLIFVVHPAGVEGVSYITQLSEPLHAFFVLLSFVLLLNYQDQPSRNRLVAVGFLFLLGLLTKENAVVFLPMVLLYLFLFAREKLKVWGPVFIGSFITYLGIRFVFYGVQTERPYFIAPISEASFFERLLTAPFIFFTYLKTFFFPNILSVAQHNVIKNPTDSSFWFSLVVVILFCLVSLGIIYKKKSKLGLFFFTSFLISLSPTLNIVMPLDMSLAEHWFYLPMAILVGFLSATLVSTKVFNKHPSILILSLSILIILLAGRTIVRNTNWKNGLTLYGHDLQNQPNNFDLENNYGVELFRIGKTEEALAHFKKSVELRPQWNISNNNLGAVYERLGDLKNAKVYYKRSVQLSDYYLAYDNLSSLFAKTEEPDEALKFLEIAIRKFPNSERVNNALAITYYKKGDIEQALYFAQRAISISPSQQNLSVYDAILNKKKLELDE